MQPKELLVKLRRMSDSVAMRAKIQAIPINTLLTHRGVNLLVGYSFGF